VGGKWIRPSTITPIVVAGIGSLGLIAGAWFTSHPRQAVDCATEYSKIAAVKKINPNAKILISDEQLQAKCHISDFVNSFGPSSIPSIAPAPSP
jgi:hypothetical protein